MDLNIDCFVRFCRQIMSFYRSDEVAFFKLVLPRESAWDIMNRLGRQELIHIVPSKSPIMNKPFLKQVKRCDEALQRLHTLQALLEEKGLYLKRHCFSEEAYSQLFKVWENQWAKAREHPASLLNDVIGEIDYAWGYHQDLKRQLEVLSHKMSAYRDNLALLKSQGSFGRQFFTVRMRASQFEEGQSTTVKLGSKCGVISIQDELRFKRTVFRMTKGNSLVTCIPFRNIYDVLLVGEQTRVAFYILYPGGADSYLQKKLSRLVQSFCSEQYQLPSSGPEYDQIMHRLQLGLIETENLLNLTKNEMKEFLLRLVEPMAESQFFRRHEYQSLYLIRERQLYAGMSEMQLFNNFMQGNVYVRKDDVEELQRVMFEWEKSNNHPVGQLLPAQIENYPTHFITNDFTCSAQQIVETYGVAHYKEANPALFTCITFPFLFGVMFGDIGHGLILFGFGLFIIFCVEEQTRNSVFRLIRPHRYMICLMGFFATFCGFIYNDYLSISLNLFGSCYDVEGASEGQFVPRYEGCVYPFGLDPVWSISENNLAFVNSLKMKMSVIIGVLHMTLGVFIKGSNAVYFGRFVDFLFQFLPQLVFLVSLFGYMDFLIVYKWTVDWEDRTDMAPSIITTMINLPLKLGQTGSCCGEQPMWGYPSETTQDAIQYWLLMIALLCIPLMLVPKPLYLIKFKRDDKQREEDSEGQQLGKGLLLNSSESVQLQESFRELKLREESADQIVVHQLIQTIQYVLGCISNTASYLRLWALSLAHSQLSQVFFDKLVQKGIVAGYVGIPSMLLGFLCLSGVTFGVLLCMDSMQCFLHALRLHWVQFNNKFYRGGGFPFVYFSFRGRIKQQLLIAL